MKMEQLFKDRDLARDDQVNSDHSVIIDGEIFGDSGSLRFPRSFDLNPTRMVIAELLGTFILMFSICGIIASTQLLRGEVGLLGYAATAGFTVVVIIFSIGAISGAHVNPAITLAFATFGHFPWPKVPFYVLAQITGSVLATYVGECVYGIKPDLFATRPLQGCAASAFWVELIASFIIVFVAASLLHHASCINHLSGFVIGAAIGLAVLITGPVSGGSMNPARSIGPAIISWNFKDIWVYITAPVIGAIAGVLMFKALTIQKQPNTISSNSNSGSGSNSDSVTTDSSPNTGLLAHSVG